MSSKTTNRSSPPQAEPGSFAGKVVNLQRDFASNFNSSPLNQRYDPVDFLSMNQSDSCKKHGSEGCSYLDLKNEKKICFACLLRWYTVEAEEHLKQSKMPSLSEELDQFLCIEERYKHMRANEKEAQPNVIIDLEETKEIPVIDVPDTDEKLGSP